MSVHKNLSRPIYGPFPPRNLPIRRQGLSLLPQLIPPMYSATAPLTLSTQIPPVTAMRNVPIPNPPRPPVELVLDRFRTAPALINSDDKDFLVVSQHHIPATVTTQQSFVTTQAVDQSGQDVIPTDQRITEIRQQVEQQSLQVARTTAMSSLSTDELDDNIPLARISRDVM